MIRRIKAAEAANVLGIERHTLKALRDHGFLIGTRSGHGFLYDTEELETFIRITRGYDLSNEHMIALAAQIIQPTKNAALHGSTYAATSTANKSRSHTSKKEDKTQI